MNLTDLGIIVGFLIALSLAAERLVEAVKKLIPWLEKGPLTDPPPGEAPPLNERLRLLCLYALAFLASWFSAAWLVNDSTPAHFDMCGRILFTLADGKPMAIPVVVIGLLCMGGSKFWRDILEYIGAVKDARTESVNMKRLERADMEKGMQMKAHQVPKG